MTIDSIWGIGCRVSLSRLSRTSSRSCVRQVASAAFLVYRPLFRQYVSLTLYSVVCTKLDGVTLCVVGQPLSCRLSLHRALPRTDLAPNRPVDGEIVLGPPHLMLYPRLGILRMTRPSTTMVQAPNEEADSITAPNHHISMPILLGSRNHLPAMVIKRPMRRNLSMTIGDIRRLRRRERLINQSTRISIMTHQADFTNNTNNNNNHIRLPRLQSHSMPIQHHTNTPTLISMGNPYSVTPPEACP